jgi:hypothetical protein
LRRLTLVLKCAAITGTDPVNNGLKRVIRGYCPINSGEKLKSEDRTLENFETGYGIPCSDHRY